MPEIKTTAVRHSPSGPSPGIEKKRERLNKPQDMKWPRSNGLIAIL